MRKSVPPTICEISQAADRVFQDGHSEPMLFHWLDLVAPDLLLASAIDHTTIPSPDLQDTLLLTRKLFVHANTESPSKELENSLVDYTITRLLEDGMAANIADSLVRLYNTLITLYRLKPGTPRHDKGRLAKNDVHISSTHQLIILLSDILFLIVMFVLKKRSDKFHDDPALATLLTTGLLVCYKSEGNMREQFMNCMDSLSSSAIETDIPVFGVDMIETETISVPQDGEFMRFFNSIRKIIKRSQGSIDLVCTTIQVLETRILSSRRFIAHRYSILFGSDESAVQSKCIEVLSWVHTALWDVVSLNAAKITYLMKLSTVALRLYQANTRHALRFLSGPVMASLHETLAHTILDPSSVVSMATIGEYKSYTRVLTGFCNNDVAAYLIYQMLKNSSVSSNSMYSHVHKYVTSNAFRTGKGVVESLWTALIQDIPDLLAKNQGNDADEIMNLLSQVLRHSEAARTDFAHNWDDHHGNGSGMVRQAVRIAISDPNANPNATACVLGFLNEVANVLLTATKVSDIVFKGSSTFRRRFAEMQTSTTQATLTTSVRRNYVSLLSSLVHSTDTQTLMTMGGSGGGVNSSEVMVNIDFIIRALHAECTEGGSWEHARAPLQLLAEVVQCREAPTTEREVAGAIQDVALGKGGSGRADSAPVCIRSAWAVVVMRMLSRRSPSHIWESVVALLAQNDSITRAYTNAWKVYGSNVHTEVTVSSTLAWEESVVMILGLIERVMDLQDVFLRNVCESERGSHGWYKGVEMALYRTEQGVSVVPLISRLVHYDRNLEVCGMAIRLTQRLCQSRVYPKQEISMVSLLFNQSTADSDKIITGFADRLKARELRAVCSTNIEREKAYSVREDVLHFLIADIIHTTSPDLRVAHVLLGLQDGFSHNENVGGSPNPNTGMVLFDSDTIDGTCLPIILDNLALILPVKTTRLPTQADKHTDTLMYEDVHPHTPSFAERCLYLLFQLCKHPLTTTITLRRLEAASYSRCRNCFTVHIRSSSDEDPEFDINSDDVTRNTCECSDRPIFKPESFISVMVDYISHSVVRASNNVPSVSVMYQTGWLLKIFAILLRTHSHNNNTTDGLASGGRVYEHLLHGLFPPLWLSGESTRMDVDIDGVDQHEGMMSGLLRVITNDYEHFEKISPPRLPSSAQAHVTAALYRSERGCILIDIDNVCARLGIPISTKHTQTHTLTNTAEGFIASLHRHNIYTESEVAQVHRSNAWRMVVEVVLTTVSKPMYIPHPVPFHTHASTQTHKTAQPSQHQHQRPDEKNEYTVMPMYISLFESLSLTAKDKLMNLLPKLLSFLSAYPASYLAPGFAHACVCLMARLRLCAEVVNKTTDVQTVDFAGYGEDAIKNEHSLVGFPSALSSVDISGYRDNSSNFKDSINCSALALRNEVNLSILDPELLHNLVLGFVRVVIDKRCDSSLVRSQLYTCIMHFIAMTQPTVNQNTSTPDLSDQRFMDSYILQNKTQINNNERPWHAGTKTNSSILVEGSTHKQGFRLDGGMNNSRFDASQHFGSPRSTVRGNVGQSLRGGMSSSINFTNTSNLTNDELEAKFLQVGVINTIDYYGADLVAKASSDAIASKKKTSGSIKNNLTAYAMISTLLRYGRKNVWDTMVESHTKIILTMMESDDEVLCDTISSALASSRQPETSPLPLFVYEQRMAILTQMASVEQGAKMLVGGRAVERMSACNYLDIEPLVDCEEPMDRYTLGMSRSERYDRALQATFRFLLSLLKCQSQNKIACKSSEGTDLATRIYNDVSEYMVSKAGVVEKILSDAARILPSDLESRSVSTDLLESMCLTGSSGLTVLAYTTAVVCKLKRRFENTRDDYRRHHIKIQTLMHALLVKYIKYEKWLEKTDESEVVDHLAYTLCKQTIRAISSSCVMYFRRIVQQDSIQDVLPLPVFRPGITMESSYDNGNATLKHIFEFNRVMVKSLSDALAQPKSEHLIDQLVVLVENLVYVIYAHLQFFLQSGPTDDNTSSSIGENAWQLSGVQRLKLAELGQSQLYELENLNHKPTIDLLSAHVDVSFIRLLSRRTFDLVKDCIYKHRK
eukprot:CFRG4249T1